MKLLAFVFAMYVVGSVPPSVSVHTWNGAHEQGADPFVLGSYLVSEHSDDWTEEPGACSSAGACGPFQLTRHWERAFDFPPGARLDADQAARIAAGVLVYSKNRHEKCDEGHDWRAHLKAGPGGRNNSNVRFSVRRWKSYERRLRALVRALYPIGGNNGLATRANG